MLDIIQRLQVLHHNDINVTQCVPYGYNINVIGCVQYGYNVKAAGAGGAI